MYTKTLIRILAWSICSILLTSFSIPIAVYAGKNPIQTPSKGGIERYVVQASRMDDFPELRTIQPLNALEITPTDVLPEVPNLPLPKALKGASQEVVGNLSTKIDHSLALESMPPPQINIDGLANLFSGWPPDTQGDIGPNHYIQWINLHFAVWEIDKVNHTATKVYGPVAGNTLFSGFGGVCQNANHGDPITLYDPFADRWFMSQFALPNYPYGPFYQCAAVSATPDPLGSWHRYEFQMPVNKMNDYPKFGVWPNAYYMTINQFNSGTSSWAGAGAAALDREAMIDGLPARMVYFDLFMVNEDFGGMLPADFDGTLPSEGGLPGYFAEWDDGSWIGPQDGLRVWEFKLDWDHPDEADFGIGGEPNWFIPTQDVDPSMCAMIRNCIPQPNTATKLDAISDRLMYRLQYRDFGGYKTLVTNHTIDVDGSDHAGIHWFELRKATVSPGWTLYQEGIYAPDADNRWMASIAMDHSGNLALGYSVSSSSIFPSVRYTGRLAGDPQGSMSQGEVSLIAGSGSQTGSNRWGDYSMMGIDPVDDCTFWYTQEYVANSGSNTWRTRIGSFRFPSCSMGPQGRLRGRVTDSQSGEGIGGAKIQATLSLTQTLTTSTNSAGEYLIYAPVGTFTVTATAFGYYPKTETGVEILEDNETLRDFALELAPTHTISGTVYDEATGWPLYAKVTSSSKPGTPIWTDPSTGFFSLTMPEGTDFSLTAESYLPGYLPETISVSHVVEDLTIDFAMKVDSLNCSQVGYEQKLTPIYSSDFEADGGGLTPGGTTSWAWGTIASGPGTAHSPTKGWATNLAGNYTNNENGTLSLPTIDLSGYAGKNPAVGWWQWLETEVKYDYASLEISKDNGLSWNTIYGPVSGGIDHEWTYHNATIDTSFAVQNLMLRFRFTSDISVTYAGWYLDDLQVGIGECLPRQGGFVTGQVMDGNTQDGLNQAKVYNQSGDEAITTSTPNDPNLGEGFYLMFTPAGTQTFTATLNSTYQDTQEIVDVPQFGAIRKDFLLEAGKYEIDPLEVGVTLELGETATQTIQLNNLGGIDAEFEWIELNGGAVIQGPFEKPNGAMKPFKAELSSSQGLGLASGPETPEVAGGEVIQSWLAGGVNQPWAAAYDVMDNSVWVSSPSVSWNGDDKLFEFSQIGEPTGRTYDQTLPHSSGPADMAYNWNSGNLWIMNVNTGVANCIYEIDPDFGYTGKSICPGGGSGFELSQRGLAYDPDTDTWFAGGWNDMMIYRFDSNGTILSSKNVSLAIAGLAYNPKSQHLFAITNSNPTLVYVLDTANDYALLGQFSISMGFGAYAGAGLEFDCDGKLWAVDLVSEQITQFESGEAASLCKRDVSWISTEPVSGTLASKTSIPIKFHFDASLATIDQPGLYTMKMKLKEETPYLVPNLPVSMTVTAPESWGKLEGEVSSLGYCDGSSDPLKDAEVKIMSSGGMTWTVQTSDTGVYQRWLDEAGSPYTLTVSAADHLPATTSGIIVTGGMTSTLDFPLFWMKPCVSFTPSRIDKTLKFGKTVTSTVSFDNTGHTDTPFEWKEVPAAGMDATDIDWVTGDAEFRNATGWTRFY